MQALRRQISPIIFSDDVLRLRHCSRLYVGSFITKVEDVVVKFKDLQSDLEPLQLKSSCDLVILHCWRFLSSLCSEYLCA
nr:hypothetical protein [Tanacetum cinerariifolium]